VAKFGGFTAASRRIVPWPGGGTAFAKGATDDPTEDWLRIEHFAYTHLAGGFMPRLLGWDDSGERPVLYLEDLASARWPPPWLLGDEELVLAALDELHSATPPPGLVRAETRWPNDWPRIGADSEPFLRLGLVSSGWFEAHLPALSAAAERVPLAGDAVIHMDVRSDNLCFLEGRALLVDWNLIALGNPAADAQFWLPSLVLEGGRPPVELEPEFAAWITGFMASRAGLPLIPTAPGVRAIQLAQLRVVLPWACRLLGLAPPDGPEEFRRAGPGINFT